MLLQTMENLAHVAIHKEFRTVDDWSDYEASPDTVLFYCSVIKNVFQNDRIRKCKEAKLAQGLSFPELRISPDGTDRILLWGGTEHERSIVLYSEPLSLVRLYRAGGQWHDTTQPISLDDYHKYGNLELTTMRAYPELHERLALCADLGVNVDPLKEITFRRELPVSFWRYVDIIGGKVELSQLGY